MRFRDHGFLPYSGTGGRLISSAPPIAPKAARPSSSTAKDDSVSRIVPTLSNGTHVTTGKNDVSYVVTEYGVAQLRGKTAKQRAEALIGIAHPDFRGELLQAAKAMHVL